MSAHPQFQQVLSFVCMKPSDAFGRLRYCFWAKGKPRNQSDGTEGATGLRKHLSLFPNLGRRRNPGQDSAIAEGTNDASSGYERVSNFAHFPSWPGWNWLWNFVRHQWEYFEYRHGGQWVQQIPKLANNLPRRWSIDDKGKLEMLQIVWMSWKTCTLAANFMETMVEKVNIDAGLRLTHHLESFGYWPKFSAWVLKQFF